MAEILRLNKQVFIINYYNNKLYTIPISIYKLYYFIESSDEGSEIMLKLRLSSNCQDIKMPLMTRDTIAQAKKKLQVSIYKFLFTNIT